MAFHHSERCLLPGVDAGIEGALQQMDKTLMPITVPAEWTKWANGIPKAFYDILALEGAQNALPVNMNLLGGSLGAYAVLQAIDHSLEHSWGGSIIYGLGSAALVGVSTFLFVPRYDTREKTIQTTIALAGVGAIIAFASIVLHFVFAVALPPPLPTERLVNFLLFPLVLWNFFAFTYLYRHAKLRSVPAFSFAAAIVIILDFVMARLLH
ncbi:MAG: hypothetical protein WAK01_05145 [Methylocystis sp.]